MPLYEYQCEACGLKFEVRQKFSDPVIEECRECGGPVKKLISQSGFALKGSGWFQQGYSSSTTSTCEAKQAAGGACAGCPKAANG